METIEKKDDALDKKLAQVRELCGSLDCIFTIDRKAGTWKCWECGDMSGLIDE